MNQRLIDSLQFPICLFQVMASEETPEIDAPTPLRDDNDKDDESTSMAGSQEDGPKPEEISKDGAQQEIAEREKITQTTQGIEVTASHEATTSKSAEDKAKDYSSFTTWEKRFIVFTATIAALFSPFTAQIYFPALNTIAKDLHVTNSKVNLTVTTYMVCFLSLSDFPFPTREKH
jgi:hypothetical protein